MNINDLSYYWCRLKDNPARLLKIIKSRNARGILLHLPFEPSVFQFLNYFIQISEEEIDCLRAEYLKASLFQKFQKEYLYLRQKKILVHQKWHELMYFLIRKLKPETIVETGVFDGISSFFILLALEKNKQGKLYSIDLPAIHKLKGSTDEMSELTLPLGKNPGWVVPKELVKRWKLILGSSKTYLPKVVAGVGKIDVFIHDSMHTDEYMMWEYKTAWKVLNKGGFLCSDDIHVGKAFWQFSKQVRKQKFHKSGFGVIIK